MLTVSVPAPDRNLLTLNEMKSALGIAGSASDDALTVLGLQISDLISAECRVPVDGVKPPTLRSETIVETFRQIKTVHPLILSRRFVGAISSLAKDGVALTASDYEVDKAAGLVSRLNSAGGVICWPSALIVATYTAGFDTVPEMLKLAAITVLREQWAAIKRDPLLRRERVDGIGEREYWVNSATGQASLASAVSGVAEAMLSSYRYWPL
jgi:hypothetical protein